MTCTKKKINEFEQRVERAALAVVIKNHGWTIQPN